MTDRAVRPTLLDKLRCPFCGSRTSKVINGRPDPCAGLYWRQRQCLNPACGETFTTTETVQPVDRPRPLRNM
jgi:transcriptional regulator NrdR family protein